MQIIIKRLNVSVSIWFHCDLHEATKEQVKKKKLWLLLANILLLPNTDHPHDDDDACRRAACGRVGDEGEVRGVDVLLRRLQQVFFHPSFFQALYVLMQEVQPLFAFLSF